MAREKDLLMAFLNAYSEEAVGRALGMYEKMQQGIRVSDIRGQKYYLEVNSGSDPNKAYRVLVSVLKDGVEAHCNCPAMARFGACKHAAVSVIHIIIRVHVVKLEQLVKKFNDAGYNMKYSHDNDTDEQMPPAIIADINEKQEKRKFVSAPPGKIFHAVSGYFGYASRMALSNISLAFIDEVQVILNFKYKVNKSTTFFPQIQFDRNETFFYKCDCKEMFRMCDHVRASFLFLEVSNRDFFYKYKNYDNEKNALLKPYGLTVADKEAEEMEFKMDQWGNLGMKPPSWIWGGDITNNINGLKHILAPHNGKLLNRPGLAKDTIIDFEIGFLFNLTSQHFKIGFELEPVKIFEKNDKEQVKKLGLHQKESLALLKELPDDIYELMLRLTDDGVKKHLADEGYRAVLNYANPWGQMDALALASLKRYYVGVVQQLWPYLGGNRHVYILKEGTFANNNLQTVKLSADTLSFRFTITEDARYITISQDVELNGEMVAPDKIKRYCGFLFEIDRVLFLPASIADLDMLWQFGQGYIKIPLHGKQEVIKTVIPLLQSKYSVIVPQSLMAQVMHALPTPQVMLKELDGKFLMLQPQYVYNGITVNHQSNPASLFINNSDGGYYIIERSAELEKTFFDSLRSLHPRFMKPAVNDFFYLPFEDTMKQNWFINTIARLVEDNVTVLGFQELKQHRYNTSKPKWEIKAGSGIDWFDMEIQISFGEQVVALRDVRKALFNRQNIVVLGDGTFGVLPEEWLKQYGMLLKMGDEQKDGTLRVSKLHYTLIDELHGQVDDEAILQEIQEKKQKLLNIGEIQKVKLSKAVKASLRPYQLSGFHWFHTLDEMGWGGCLADDMGLGKTLQAIAFLQYLKEKYKDSTHIVICPTSLIYNWESELQKFGPKLRYHIYYGLERELTNAHFNDYDVIITSYGIIRNDLEELMKFDWHYIILDESQAIKNPEAQTNKALQLLKSKNRMILSGTPIQNNTFDLFAQFNFINPGLLGNKEFFKTEFANPIDKNNDAEKSAQLRRLIYPFMLRRTKEQVAPDLPDKTETILWCEMGKEQRAVYNEYKDYYRSTLMEKIAEVGMAKAGMYVLEGLLRLRQICDSPVLVKDNEVTTRKSVKIHELTREIEENSGGHKLLVFSQFTEMLHLIEDSLRAQQVNYVYLDGSTPAEKRKEAVLQFQEDPGIRVFLISLKAGGVGLNLTTADYVYIVDPWWNPAVEQQAIDRTHRIGQTNKIFAYKMICKDTVEEKIVQLQQRKKQLANDLVTEDAGFIKKLNREDIAFLFS